MLVAIHQLHYLPWLRYFEKIARADIFIALDNAQFNKNGWQNRNRIKTAAGPALLTVPVNASLGRPLDDVRIAAGQPWRRKHWASLQQSYGRAPHFAAHEAFFAEAYGREWERLNALNRHLLEYLVDALGIETHIAYASELDVPGEATERLANLIKAVGGTRYYSGAFALDTYLDRDLLEEAGIDLVPQEWRAPVYPQLHGAFVPDLSIVDLLWNCGPDSLAVLTGGAA